VPHIGLVTVRPRPGDRASALAARLRADPAVASVQPEHRFTLRLTPNDPALSAIEPSAPPGTVVQWWAERENLPAAWDVSQGDGATVAVIDTGIDASHPEFAGRISGTLDLDDQLGDGPPTTDQVGHGTHVASLACATAGNGIGLAGAGFHCSMLVIKSDLSDSSVSAAIVAAADRGVDAINMSFGTDGSSPAADSVVRAIDYAYQRGVVMVAAAADDPVTEQGDPSNVLQPTGTGPDIAAGKGLSVTAADFNDQRSYFAGHGTQISMAAYGSFGTPGGPAGIFGAFPGNLTLLETGPPPNTPCACRTTFQGDTKYAYVQGTSMAAPMIAAIAALMSHTNPGLGAGDIIRLLKETARRPAGSGWSPDLGWGIVDARAALDAARGIDRTAPVSRLRAPGLVHGKHKFKVRWSGFDPTPAGLTASGIDHFEIWRSVNGRPARRVVNTRGTFRRFRGRPGSTYSFFTIAVDRAGNREAGPTRPDARVRVVRR
jgi:subtilisin family serine protease